MTVATVLLDTNVFTAWLRPSSTPVPIYGKHVFGRRIAIAQQTVAEVRYGAHGCVISVGRQDTPLHQKQHGGDLWIAATAIRWQLPLVAHDGIFFDCPDVQLLTELPCS